VGDSSRARAQQSGESGASRSKGYNVLRKLAPRAPASIRPAKPGRAAKPVAATPTNGGGIDLDMGADGDATDRRFERY